MEQKRSTPRYKIQLKVEIKGVNRVFNAETADISLKGMFLKTTHNFPVDSFLELKCVIEPMNSSIEMLGKVIHQIPGYGVGILFIEYKDNALKMIETLILYTLKNIESGNN
ncbi:PilZ domain-containing protein [bacterium]|nr:PilZ domain-containing protein [bacterium]